MKIMEYLSHYNRPPDRDLKPVSPTYEEIVAPTQL
jgi:hypothetical protein